MPFSYHKRKYFPAIESIFFLVRIKSFCLQLAIMGEDTYSIDFICRNCGTTGSINVPKGTKLENMPCPNCDCKALELFRRPLIK